MVFPSWMVSGHGYVSIYLLPMAPVPRCNSTRRPLEQQLGGLCSLKTSRTPSLSSEGVAVLGGTLQQPPLDDFHGGPFQLVSIDPSFLAVPGQRNKAWMDSLIAFLQQRFEHQAVEQVGGNPTPALGSAASYSNL